MSANDSSLAALAPKARRNENVVRRFLGPGLATSLASEGRVDPVGAAQSLYPVLDGGDAVLVGELVTDEAISEDRVVMVDRAGRVDEVGV